MVIDPKKTFVAYRCPICGKGVLSAVGVLSISADMLKLKCECGGSELTIAKGGNDKIRLTVPCLMCPKPHNFTVSRTLFFGNELFMLQCPYTDINICFFGDQKDVSAGLERTEMELLDMLGEENLMQLGGEREDQPFTDPQIYDIIMFVINDLNEEGKITCLCENEEDSELTVEVLDDGVRVACKTCGASQTIPTDSLLGAHAFLNCDRLNLTKE